MADALSDALLIARSRGARLGADELGLADGTPAIPASSGEARDVLAYRAPRRRAHGLFTLPGHDLASAPAARRHVRDTAGVTISVTDEGGRSAAVPVPAPPPLPPSPEEERGRGLLITDALAARWGTRQSGRGPTVWAEVHISRSSSNG
ncbi:hypothetical protein [Streptomyces djakartensis]|uniref:hypothetical protein n=1 Tax=Streptomyces djakartensis TaxID=68193 RepID=UPI00167D3EF8|nr:hypothetical protein [Streptomyces djakartensis]